MNWATVLLGHEAQVDLRSTKGFGVLFMTSEYKNLEVAALFLVKGAQVDL